MEIETAGKLKQIFDDMHIPYHMTKTWTTDAFYRETERNMEKRKEEGCGVVEMECASVMAVGQFRKKEVYQFLYAADCLDGKDWEKRILGNMPETLRERIFLVAMELGGMPAMKLKNILIVVKDIEKSKQFYHDLFGLDMLLDNNGNMILTEGLVLQDEKIWRKFLGKDIIPKSNSCELYFEEQDIEAFIEKLEKIYPSVQYVNRLMTHSWGQKVVRFYDFDGNLIEVGTPM